MPGGVSRDVRPLDDPDDMVSKESVPCSSELDTSGGKGGTTSAGASRPFLVVAEADREPRLNRPFALGADATRRMKREAEAPMDLGESGPPAPRDLEGVVGVWKEPWDGSAVSGLLRGEFGVRERAVRCRSDLVYARVLAEGPTESASADFGCCCWW